MGQDQNSDILEAFKRISLFQKSLYFHTVSIKKKHLDFKHPVPSEMFGLYQSLISHIHMLFPENGILLLLSLLL